MVRVEAVLFDYGGVLTSSVSDSLDAWLRGDRVEPDSFSRVMRRWFAHDAPSGTPIHRLETGELPGDDFGRVLAAELVGLAGQPIEPDGLLRRMFAGMRPDRAMFGLVRDLRNAGVRVGLVSNSWGNTYPRPEIDELFAPVVISGEVGIRKPDRAIYDLALQRLGLPAESVIFVDDAQTNVDGAVRAGLHGFRHVDAATTRATLAERLPQFASRR